ncbi:MAG: protein kinase [Ruminococcus sp.]|nr:protein kinase [Ruminococcus sp.]
MRCVHCMKEIKDGIKFCPYCGGKPSEQNPPHQLAAGTVLKGKYLIGSAIGEGGFGITYVGYDLTLEIKIAVKEYFPAGYANRFNAYTNSVTINYNNSNDYFAHGKENFLLEAKSIAKFSQENGIVDVREYFTENNTAYIVMEYLDGKNLSKYIHEKGVFKPDAIIRLMIPLMRSLDKMHSENIIHRDISPDNIMLLKSGMLKITDFGSARYFSDEGAKTMSVLLKPGYAPYEQYSRKSAQGPWTDVYGLCATIYKCITGETPPDSLDRCAGDDLKPPSQLGIGISPAFESVLMHGLEVYSKDRCKNMTELIALCEKALSSPDDVLISVKDAPDPNRTMAAGYDNDPWRTGQNNTAGAAMKRTADANSGDAPKRFPRTAYMGSSRRTRSSFTRYDPGKTYSVRMLENKKFYSQSMKKLREQNPNINYDPQKNYIYRISDDPKYYRNTESSRQNRNGKMSDNSFSARLSGIRSIDNNTVSANYDINSRPITYPEIDEEEQKKKKERNLIIIGVVGIIILIVLFSILIASCANMSKSKTTESSSSQSYNNDNYYDYLF